MAFYFAFNRSILITCLASAGVSLVHLATFLPEIGGREMVGCSSMFCVLWAVLYSMDITWKWWQVEEEHFGGRSVNNLQTCKKNRLKFNACGVRNKPLIIQKSVVWRSVVNNDMRLSDENSNTK